MRIALRVSAVVLAAATIGAIGSAGARALQGRQVAATRDVSPDTPPIAAPSDSAEPKSTTQPSARTGVDSAADIPAPLAAAPWPDEPDMKAPVVDEGRTDLGDGIFVLRAGRRVEVHFDVPQSRTRRRDKFDRIVRATLPRIYGPAAQLVLDRIPEGQLVAAPTLPAELQESGLHIPITDSSTIALWPEVRYADGGPLVVGYRTEVAR